MIKTAAKFTLAVIVLLTFMVLALASRYLSVSSFKAQQRAMRAQRWYCRTMLRLLNVRTHIEDHVERVFTGDEGILFVPNHISYVDVLVIGAHIPSTFVTSREIEATPILGHVTKAAGCAFVERRHKGDVLRDINQLASLLNDGHNVTVFPEGSTSPGDGLMEFKKTLLESAVRSRCRVVPLCLRYERIDGRRYDPSNRDLVAWYGDMTFFPHLWRLLATNSVDVRLTVLHEVAFRGHKSRKRIARDAKAQIAARFHA